MKAWLLKWFGPVGEYLSAILNSAVHQELKIVLPIATKLVKQVASDPTLLNGGAKFDAALAGVLLELGAAQSQVAISTVSLAIELAYTKFKLEQPVPVK
jgi:hypothetical protein